MARSGSEFMTPMLAASSVAGNPRLVYNRRCEAVGAMQDPSDTAGGHMGPPLRGAQS